MARPARRVRTMIVESVRHRLERPALIGATLKLVDWLEIWCELERWVDFASPHSPLWVKDSIIIPTSCMDFC
jgi:hypothetical protein